MKLINIYSEHEANPKDYETDEVYYSLEIHIIGEKPGINVTDIAIRHGISKSVVSKVLKKLEKKVLLIDIKQKIIKKRYYLS